MRRFLVVRDEDVSGTSGTGIICEGLQASTDKVAVFWLGAYPSVAVWDSIEQAQFIHGHGGKTRIVWVDDEFGFERPRGGVGEEVNDPTGTKPYPVNRLVVSDAGIFRHGSRLSDGSILLDDGTVWDVDLVR